MGVMSLKLRTALVLVVAVAASACAGARRAAGPPLTVGAPVSLSAPDLQGQLVDIAADRGQVRIIHFWACWCKPCGRALPALDALARELGPRGVRIYAVTIDEDRAALTTFLAKHAVALPILWDDQGAQLGRLDAHMMPVSLVVDRRGILRHVNQGWSEESVDRERQQIEALLAEP
jgi:cytochrome c biogenesis protein CcmG, thiol:disulfide interchange protein DsbE